jgi:ribose transport system ATP-binding protein
MEPSPIEGRNEPVLVAAGVSKTYGATAALTDANLILHRGTVHALLGGNGAGKSTLIKILAGVETADSGTLTIRGCEPVDLRQTTPATPRRLGLHFVHQQPSTFPDLSVAENLALGSGYVTTRRGRISWRTQRDTARRVLERFHVRAHPDQLMSSVNPATRKMIEIARALQDVDSTNDGVLVLDEPTAALPHSDARTLLDAIRVYVADGHTIVYVTHRLEEVFEISDAATLLRNGRVVGVVAPADIDHDQLVEQMMGHVVAPAVATRQPDRTVRVLELRDRRAEHLSPIDLTVHAGETVGLAGLIGSGRTRLLRSLFGLVPATGDMLLGGATHRCGGPHEAIQAGIAYVPEDRGADAAFARLSVRENLTIADLGRHWNGRVISRHDERDEANALLRRFLVRAGSPESPLLTLSGGNQQKVILARWMRLNPRLLLLDEPTQGVDVNARAEIYGLVNDAVGSGAGALVASSDFDELAAICDRVLVMWRGAIVKELAGDELSVDAMNRFAHVGAAA